MTLYGISVLKLCFMIAIINLCTEHFLWTLLVEVAALQSALGM